MSRVLPILFNTDMTEAILQDRKTATRRLINAQNFTMTQSARPQFFVGDILYVRETWAFQACVECKDLLMDDSCSKKITPTTHEDKDTDSEGCYIYRAGHPHPDRITWRPSIHMPKTAARIWLRVTDAKIQRLQDMTLDDFLREGVAIRPEAYNDPENAYTQAREIFAGIWDSTLRGSDKDKFGWPANPRVRVIEFEQCERPEEGGC